MLNRLRLIEQWNKAASEAMSEWRDFYWLRSRTSWIHRGDE